MKFNFLNISLLLIGVIFTFSCKKEEEITPINNFSDVYNLPNSPYNYNEINFPETFTSEVFNNLDNTPNNNPTTNNGATLGRVLFYDKNLSFNKTISCASCHKQEFGFADPIAKSIGFNGEQTRRNTMNIVNTRFYRINKFFWDHRANSLEEQVLMPFKNEIEMGMTLDLLTTRVQADYYKPLFKKAFNSEEITTTKIAKALAQFIRSIVSFNSKYDKGLELTRNIFIDFPNFTAQENMGKDIFNGKLTVAANGNCAFCHIEDQLHYSNMPSLDINQVIFSGTRTDNIGLDELANRETDNGLGEITNVEADNGQFKVPSLRNIALTAPYMHDGRFNTLEEVVEHYSTKVKAHPQLSDHLINGDGTPRHLNLTNEESAALVAFLKTLTDNHLITDTKYSDPFTN